MRGREGAVPYKLAAHTTGGIILGYELLNFPGGLILKTRTLKERD